jgi:crotonobetainyl-CoA:carnitine CoA-transferase CaiB-like acyl-CoA transferase
MSAAGAPPLGGYKVLELGSTVAGPFCGRLLADFGAEVVKVESPEGDPVRAMGGHEDGKSLYAASILRNKRLIALDLRQEEAQQLVRRMVEKVDVLIENFRPGTLEKWGLGPEELHRINPGLVIVRISGFGQTGPYRDRPGYGFLGDAVGGMLHINGYPDRAPVRAAVPVTDMVTGIYAALGASMALLARKTTGRGQVVDAALFECAFSLMESHVAPFQKLGKVAMRAGSRLPGSTPNNLYPTRDGGYIAMAAASDSVFRRLATVMGKPELGTDPRFATGMARVKNEDALDEILAAWTSTFELRELEAMLQREDVPASRIFTMADIFTDSHYAARGTIIKATGGEVDDEVAMPVPVPRLSETPGIIRHSGREIGSETADVLMALAGLSADEVKSMHDRKVVYDAALASEPHPEVMPRAQVG